MVGISIAADRRGEGWAAPLIDRGCVAASHLDVAPGVRRFTARVKPDNVASSRAFVLGDFDLAADDVVGDEVCTVLHRDREGVR